MRVLLTGMTRRQTNLTTRGREYMTVFRCLYEALEHDGHEVTWRPVTIYEEGLRDQYDVAVIGLHAVGSLATAYHKWGALWCFHEMPSVLVFEDWRIKAVTMHMKTQDYLFGIRYVGDEDMIPWELARQRWQLFDKLRERISVRIPVQMLPLHPWGDPRVLEGRDFRQRAESHHAFLVDSFYYEIGHPRPPEEKTRRWVMVSLSNQDRWLDRLGELEWETRFIHKPREHSRPGIGGVAVRDFIPETELVPDWYDTSWGILMPGYGKACPVGWWRSRPVLSAQSGCVLVGDERDMSSISDSHTVSAQQVEDMSLVELTALAESQQLALRNLTMSRAVAAHLVTEALRVAVQKGPVRL